MRRVKESLGRFLSKRLRILTLAVLAYTIGWSSIALLRFYALNTSVYDLGYSMQAFWFTAHLGTNAQQYLYVLGFRGIQFVLVPLFYIVPSRIFPQFLLVFQSAALGASAFPIYGIARRRLSSDFDALVIALASLVFFPLAGLNWFDFHFQALFVPFFLAGYYFYVSDRRGLALLAFGLASAERTPYAIFPLIFAITVLSEIFWRRVVKKEVGALEGQPAFALALISVSAFFLLMGTLEVQATGVSANLHSTTLSFALPGILSQSRVFFFVLGPLLFLPLISKRWLVHMLPFIAITLTSTSYGYSFPAIFQLQYLAGFVPFVWLGLIDAIPKLQGAYHRWMQGQQLPDVTQTARAHTPIRFDWTARQSFRIRRPSPRPSLAQTNLVIGIAFLVATSALFMEPYGPFNASSQFSFNFQEETQVNWTLYESLSRVLSLIPQGEQNVLTQNDLPQALVGHYNTNPLTPDLFRVPDAQEIFMDQFELSLRPLTYPINYVVGNLNSYWFYGNVYPGSTTMVDFVKLLFQSGHYGLEAESAGIFLMARNYTGPTQSFIPFATSYSGLALYTKEGTRQGDEIVGNNLTDHGTLWYGPYASALPGNYTATVTMETSNVSTNNSFQIRVSGLGKNNSLVILSIVTINGSGFPGPNRWQRFTIDFQLPNFTDTLEVAGQDMNWHGSLALGGLRIVESGA